MIEAIENDVVRCRCGCGKSFEVKRESYVLDEFYEAMICPDCGAAELEKKRRIEAGQGEIEAELSLEARIEESGIPPAFRLNQPPVPEVARWLWRYREANILLSGRTGSGKTTSACCVAMRLVAAGRRVRYRTLRKLLAEWRSAKTSDRPLEADRFLDRIGALDWLIIDEVVNKARMTDSGQELLFELLDGVYNRERNTRLWWIGNFYRGSIEEIFTEPQPVIRRLKEKFVIGLAENGQVIEMKLDGGNE